MAVDVEQIREYYMQVREYLDTLIVGEAKAKDAITSAMLADKNSRILLLGLPGTGKSTISDSLAGNFASKKISVTSDLLPSDILNCLVNNRNIENLQLEELNRASGKVQSSLVELLANNRITGDTEKVEFADFYVMATQNDSDIAGVFDVPQNIYDRFDVSIRLGNLTDEELEQVLFEYEAKCEKAGFDLKHIIDTTSNAVENFVYSPEDRRIFMEALKRINATEYSGERVFASSNIRGHLFLKKLSALHSLVNGKCVNGKTWIMPSDISDYISNVYLHRINQAILRMNDAQTDKIMQNLEKQVLSIKRNKK